MDQADAELRETITHIWPLQAKKMLDLLVPRNDVLNTGKLTVGKIYAGLLILESWRSTRFGQTEPQGVPVSTTTKQRTPFVFSKTYVSSFCLLLVNKAPQCRFMSIIKEARVFDVANPSCTVSCMFEPNVTVKWVGYTFKYPSSVCLCPYYPLVILKS